MTNEAMLRTSPQASKGAQFVLEPTASELSHVYHAPYHKRPGASSVRTSSRRDTRRREPQMQDGYKRSARQTPPQATRSRHGSKATRREQGGRDGRGKWEREQEGVWEKKFGVSCEEHIKTYINKRRIYNATLPRVLV